MSTIRLAALVALATLAAACGVAPQGADVSGNPADDGAPVVPASITVPDGNQLAFDLAATGVQIYDCKATATGFGWVFRAPSATLTNPAGEVMAYHYAGPTWQSAKGDGSLVVGAKVAGYTPDPASIPWLLLVAKSHDGHGRFATVTYVQRLYTSGGIAPATGCDADHVGDVANVDYSATYYFWQAAD